MSRPSKPLTEPDAKGKVYAKVVQLGLGLDLIGNKLSVNDNQAVLEVTPLGVKMTSRKKSGRVILLPWANIKGCELKPEAPQPAPTSGETV